MDYASPLRYPGGKKKLASFIIDSIILNDIQGGTYVEPFAGGASIALQLLFKEYVNHIIINDIDPSIYSFWYSVINETENFCKKINDTPVTMEEWKLQRTIQLNKHNASTIDLAFSTFFLNRTNRSGIIKGGVIGGKGQTGRWKMDVRYNKEDLIKRIKKIALYKNRIQLYNLDGINCIMRISPYMDKNTLIYFDPPYYNKGAALYVNHFSHQDHETLAKFILNLPCKWIITYDYTPEIIEMYRDVEKRLLTFNYTAAKKIKGNEMIGFCREFKIPIAKYPAIIIE